MLSKSQILDHVWHYDFGGDGNVVETYVSYLRKKLEVAGPPVIHTVRLVGYARREPATDLSLSLRSWLLVAFGVVALSPSSPPMWSLLGHRSPSSTNAVDQQLAGAHGSFEQRIDNGRSLPCFEPGRTLGSRPRRGGGPNRADDRASNVPAPGRPGPPRRAVARRPHICPAYVDGKAYTPNITGLASAHPDRPGRDPGRLLPPPPRPKSAAPRSGCGPPPCPTATT